MKYLIEGISNTGDKQSLRKDIWKYLWDKYGAKGNLDYRDFLLAIKEFCKEGKIINNEGYMSVHTQVLNEYNESKKTPVPKKEDVDPLKNRPRNIGVFGDGSAKIQSGKKAPLKNSGKKLKGSRTSIITPA
jgi:hypothetical protein